MDPPDMPPARRAFTLVELLVVVTIIVILLAMLMPALDRAKYQALLTVCGTRLKAIASGVTQYASAHHRHYPSRLTDPSLYDSGMFMAQTIRDYDGKFEWRPLLKPYLGLATLIDPLSEKIDLSENLTPPSEMVMSSYDLRFGWQFAAHAGITERGMFKLGDRWTWNDGVKAHEFSVLALEHDRVYRPSPGWALASHPDDRATSRVFVDTTDTNASPWYITRWDGPYNRGVLDNNYAYADGSVTRLYGVKVNDPTNSPMLDERIVRVPNYGNNGNWEGVVEWNNVIKP